MRAHIPARRCYKLGLSAGCAPWRRPGPSVREFSIEGNADNSRLDPMAGSWVPLNQGRTQEPLQRSAPSFHSPKEPGSR